MNTFSPPLPKQPIKDMKQLATAVPTRQASDRSSSGLRDLLFDEIEALRSGKGDVEKANAIAKLSQTIISSAKLDIEFSKLKTEGDLPSAIQRLSLGTK